MFKRLRKKKQMLSHIKNAKEVMDRISKLDLFDDTDKNVFDLYCMSLAYETAQVIKLKVELESK